MGQKIAKLHSAKESESANVEPVEEQAHSKDNSDNKLDARKPHLNFHFLNDQPTVDYVATSKIMFILRGLAGSGKTTIAKEIEELYKGVIVCSADHFFMMGGRYLFDPKKLKEAHEFCQERARRACLRNENIIVIDNTNVQKWEMEYYFLLAFRACYVVVLVEPQTPWKDDPLFLSIRNEHNVPEQLLQKKLEQWQTVLPLYYGWFLNESDSRMLLLVGQAYLEECLKQPEFEQDFRNFTSLTTKSEMLEYYSKRGKLLHCTSKFCKHGDVPDALEYSTKPDVVAGYGKLYDLCVIAFVMTPRTFGARVMLDSEELKLWGGEPATAPPSPQNSPRSSFKSNSQFPKKSSGLFIDVRDRETKHIPNCQASLVCVPQSNISLQPTKGFGSRAHITLGCADGIQPVTTGLDLVEIVDCETVSNQSEHIRTLEFSRGILRDYGQSRWVLYPNHKIIIKSIFTGNY